MTRDDWTVDRLRHAVCGRKHRYGERTARLVAQRMRDHGHRVSPYRCPFADGYPHWHIGHPPKMRTVVLIARAIRGLPLEDPKPHDTPSQPVTVCVTVRA